MQPYLNVCFIAATQYKDVNKDECLKHITKGFTVHHIMNVILDSDHDLICALSKKELLN